MAGRRFHLSNGMLFGVLLSVGIVLLIVNRGTTKILNDRFVRTFRPLLGIGRSFQDSAVAMPHPDEQYTLRQDHNKLWKNYKNLHAQLLKLQNDYQTLSRVRSGLPRFFSGLTVAEVVGTGTGLSQEILINKGGSDGVRVGHYVLSPDQCSVIGVVRDASEKMARVRPLTDAGQSIEIRIRRDGTSLDVGAMMFGDGKGGGIVSMVEREKDIRVGDAVYAAARPGMLDVSMIIGEVTAVEPDENSPLLWKIAVEPAEKTHALSTVVVIVSETIAPVRP